MNQSTYARRDRSTTDPILDVDALMPADSPWDYAILAILALLLLFAPFAYGVVHAGTELFALGLGAALSMCVLLRTALDAEYRLNFSWVVAPLILLLALFVLQLIELPAALAESISPQTIATKKQMLQDVGGVGDFASISIYPWETAHYLRLSLLGMAVLLTGIATFTTRRSIIRMLTVIFAIGLAQATLAMMQIMSQATSIYWLDTIPRGRVVTAGSFVNYSNYSQFMNLSIGAGLALLLIRLHDQRRSAHGQSQWQQPVVPRWWEDTRLLLGGIVLCGVTVLTSMSRNGAISLTIAATVIGVALYLKGSLVSRGWILALVPFGILFTLLLFSFDDFYARLSTLEDDRYVADRWEMFLAMLNTWRAYPVWGSGLGTHEFVFPMFDTAITPVLAERGDNDYAQLLEETGVVGAALLGIFLLSIALLGVLLMCKGRSATSTASFGFMYGLIAVGIHSGTDFGQRLPANFCITALCCAMMITIWQAEQRIKKDDHANISSKPNRVRGVAIACLGLILAGGVWTWAIRDAYAAFIGERWDSAAFGIRTIMSREGAEPTEEEVLNDYVDLRHARTTAAQADPKNVKYGDSLNQVRWELMQFGNEEGGVITLPVEALQDVERIAEELSSVRKLCPTYGPPCILEGELRYNWLGQQEHGAKLIRQGYELARYYPPACYAAGVLEATEGNIERASELLSRSVALAPSYFPSTADYFIRHLNQPELARKLAGNDYYRIRYVYRAIQGDERYADLAKAYYADYVSALRENAESDNARERTLIELAKIEEQNGKFEATAALYQRALALNPGQDGWRLDLAEALAAAGKIKEALAEAQRAKRDRSSARANKIISDLTLRLRSDYAGD